MQKCLCQGTANMSVSHLKASKVSMELNELVRGNPMQDKFLRHTRYKWRQKLKMKVQDHLIYGGPGGGGLRPLPIPPRPLIYEELCPSNSCRFNGYILTMDTWIPDVWWGAHIYGLQLSGIRYLLLNHCLSTAHALLICCLFGATCSLFTAYSGPPTAYSLLVHCLFIAYRLFIRCLFGLFTALFTGYSLFIWSPTAYPLRIHCMFAAYSNTFLPKSVRSRAYENTIKAP